MNLAFLPCIGCGSKLEHALGDSVHLAANNPNQPSEGQEFRSGGGYGCTTFDPMDGSSLAINICDPCIQAFARRGQVAHIDPQDGSYILWGQDL